MNAFKIGSVYVIRTGLTRPPKDKITLCVGISVDLFLWINTSPRPHGVGQIALSAKDHAALTHDCYLDCSRVTTFLPHELATARDRGPISAPLAQRLHQALTETPPKTLTPQTLQQLLAALATLFAA